MEPTKGEIVNELFDKLIIRIIFIFIIFLIIFVYKHIYQFIYPLPSTIEKNGFKPSQNPALTIHLFSRILGIAIILSAFHFNLSHGILTSISHLLIHSIMAIILYVLSLFIIESIVLYNFEFQEEVIQKKNLSYSAISFAHSISTALIISRAFEIAQTSFIFLIFLWLFSIVLLGISSKIFPFISHLSLNRHVIQENLPSSFIYLGFHLGSTYIIISSLQTKIISMQWYIIEIVISLLLSLILLPILKAGLEVIFKLKADYKGDLEQDTALEPNIGFGIYNAILVFVSCYLTTIIITHIDFGTFYPLF